MGVTVDGLAPSFLRESDLLGHDLEARHKLHDEKLCPGEGTHAHIGDDQRVLATRVTDDN